MENFKLAQVGTDHETVQFEYDFLPEGKALAEGGSEPVVTELEDGDLLIQGYAAVFEGIDRRGENFVDGAFVRGMKSFVDGSATLAFHHKLDHGIGKVLRLEEHPGKGLWMQARVDHQPESSPFRYIYNGIKKGTYRGLSVSGFFRRKLTEKGWRIADTDIVEISVTPVAVHPKTAFDVVAGKALTDVALPDLNQLPDNIREQDVFEIEETMRRLRAVFQNIIDTVNKRETTETAI